MTSFTGARVPLVNLQELEQQALRQNPSQLPDRPAIINVGGVPTLVEPIGGLHDLAPDRHPWERQPGESNREWAAFVMYRNLKPSLRTIKQAYLTLLKAVGRYDPTKLNNQAHPDIRAAATIWRWRERATAWDKHEDERVQQELLAQRIKVRVETADLGRELRQRAAEAAALIQSIVIQTEMIDGKPKRVLRSNLSITDITKLAKAGHDLEKWALGMDREGPVPGLEINVNVSAMAPSDEDIIQKSSQILADRQKLIELEATTR